MESRAYSFLKASDRNVWTILPDTVKTYPISVIELGNESGDGAFFNTWDLIITTYAEDKTTASVESIGITNDLQRLRVAPDIIAVGVTDRQYTYDKEPKIHIYQAVISIKGRV